MKTWSVTKATLLLLLIITSIPLLAKGEESEKLSEPSKTHFKWKSHESSVGEEGLTWLMTIPTADTLRDGRYNLGLIQGGTIPFHADVGGLWDNLEVGIHGVKLRLLKEGSPWASIAVGATFGYYPSGAYIVGSKNLKDFRAHLGARFLTFKFKNSKEEMSSNSGNMNSSSSGDGMSDSSNSDEDDESPVIIFGGISKTIPKLDNALLMLEAGDSLNGGVRFFLTSYLQVDVGVRVAWPERIRNKLGKSFSYNIVSRDTTAYLALNYSSEFKFKGGEKDEGDP